MSFINCLPKRMASPSGPAGIVLSAGTTNGTSAAVTVGLATSPTTKQKTGSAGNKQWIFKGFSLFDFGADPPSDWQILAMMNRPGMDFSGVGDPRANKGGLSRLRRASENDQNSSF
ncbi:hypothetical protein [Dechloromonas sp. H13]|uniref:hypothetical protein n=1 Tax=Dechloromonas sp. H13 TaxID=2570193 RepID=UPI001D1802F8|nr:hypothetical protein [Dechloromonas sp. H13]